MKWKLRKSSDPIPYPSKKKKKKEASCRRHSGYFCLVIRPNKMLRSGCPFGLKIGRVGTSIFPPPLKSGHRRNTIQRFSRAGPRGRGREWATLGVHPLSWLLSNNRLEEVCSTLTKGTFSSRLLLSNQDKGWTPSVAHSLPLPLGPALLNLSSFIHVCAFLGMQKLRIGLIPVLEGVVFHYIRLKYFLWGKFLYILTFCWKHFVFKNTQLRIKKKKKKRKRTIKKERKKKKKNKSWPLFSETLGRLEKGKQTSFFLFFFFKPYYGFSK